MMPINGDEATAGGDGNERSRRLLFHLEFRVIDVEVHSIDTLDFQGHLILGDVNNAARYTHDWLRSTQILRDHYRLCAVQSLRLRKQTSPIDSSLFY
jgi:hypothetical protein